MNVARAMCVCPCVCWGGSGCFVQSSDGPGEDESDCLGCLDPEALQTKIVKNQPVTSLTLLLLSLKNMIQAPKN